MRYVWMLVLLVLLACGCGTSSASRQPSTRVDEALRAEFPVEGRRWAYEAENEVIIALDRLDGAREARELAERRLAAGRASQEVAAQQGKAAEVATARVAWLEQRRDAADAAVEVAQVSTYCARTSFELTKARLALRFGLPVEKDFTTRFEKQHESCAAELAEAVEEERRAAAGAERALENWRQRRLDYVTRTGDHDHGLWID